MAPVRRSARAWWAAATAASASAPIIFRKGASPTIASTLRSTIWPASSAATSWAKSSMPWWRRTRPTAWPHTRRPTIEEGQLNDQVLEAAKRLSAAGIDSARLDARLLYGFVGGDTPAFDAV